MIKPCGNNKCCNFFKIRLKKRYCSKKCGDAGTYQSLPTDKKKMRTKQSCERYQNMTIKERIDANKIASQKRKHTKRKSYLKEYYNNRYSSDLNYKTLVLLRSRIKGALNGTAKKSSSKKLLGCSVEQLRQHLEDQFTGGMSWENHGDWHIDHIKPCAAFDLTDERQQIECFNYTNMQPLWAFDNLSKGDTY